MESTFRDESRSGDLVGTQLHGSVERYVEAYPWADAEALETNFELTKTFVAVKEAVSEYLAPYGLGLTRAEYNFLSILHLSGDQGRPLGDIAREMAVTPAWVTRLLDSLEAQGLAQRATNPHDRRIINARLTPEGQERCVSIIPEYLSFLGETGEALSSEEKQELARLLNKYRSRAEALLEAKKRDLG